MNSQCQHCWYDGAKATKNAHKQKLISAVQVSALEKSRCTEKTRQITKVYCGSSSSGGNCQSSFANIDASLVGLKSQFRKITQHKTWTKSKGYSFSCYHSSPLCPQGSRAQWNWQVINGDVYILARRPRIASESKNWELQALLSTPSI